ncbi:MAG: hypothetical protein ACOH14_04275 [Rhodoglobus sp.]
MSDSERDERAEMVSIVGVGAQSGFGSAMSACLRAQAVREPSGRVATIFGANPLSASANEHYSDAVGELEAAVALAALGPDWMVAHSVQSGSDSVSADHVVLGPSGVFLVHSSQHPHAKIVTAGRMIMVNGRRVAYVRDAIVGADRLTQEFKGYGATATVVRPIVVLGGVANLVHGRMRAPVPVLQLGELVQWILHQPAVHSPNEIKSLVSIAGRLGSWQVQTVAGSASVRLTARFERLRVEVDAARQRYRLWVVTGGITAIAATTIMFVVAAPTITGLFAG